MSKNVSKPRPSEDRWPERPVNDNAGMRRCLACKEPFDSEGWHNRLCPKCRKYT
jgi:hypothetical protein